MTDTALKEAYQRMSYALTCNEKGHYQEAYRNYLATTTYISNVLGLRSSSEVWCDDKSLKLLRWAKMCIEAALSINGTALENNSSPPENLPDSAIPRPVSSQINTTEPDNPPPPTATVDPGSDDNDIFSILDSLPEVPANKVGQKYKEPMKRSATLPTLQKPNLDDILKPPPPAPVTGPSKTLPRNTDIPKPNNIPTRSRSVYIPPPHPQYSYLPPPPPPVGSTPNSSDGVLRVSPLERAKQQNAALAAKYERRAQRGMLRPRDRLELIRAQEENKMIAMELEKVLAKKSEQRKQRLQQEGLEQETAEQVIGTYEAILYGKSEHLRKLISSAKDYDLQFRSRPTSEADQNSIDKIENVLAWCFGESSHPINKAVGEAQFNFYNRLVPLSKKLHSESKEERVSLYPGIKAEVEAITADISEFLCNLSKVLCHLYPVFNNEEGRKALQSGLSDLFFKPFLKLLLEIYSFLMEDDLAVLTKYFVYHSQDDITTHTDVKEKYHLGEAPYLPAIEALQSLTETTSPVKKLSLLVSFGQLISQSVKHYYLESGMSEEEATELSCMGADDMMPISIYIISRCDRPQLLTELQLLSDVTPEEELMGSEGYCLTTVQYAIEYIMRREKELLQKSGEDQDVGNVEENSGIS